MKDERAVAEYIEAVEQQIADGYAREHGYRPALLNLLNSFEDAAATNDPTRSEFGNPDVILYKQSNSKVVIGYGEAKDVDADLAKTLKTEQLRRYAGYEKLFLTNYLDFRFFRNGEQYEDVSIGKIKNGKLIANPKEFSRLQDVLQEFIDQPPESIRSGKQLALIMGGKARRIRDNVQIYLKHTDNEKNAELEKIFKMMKELLVHDLTPDKFADMYAQTLVYGLFVGRYNDKTPESFDRKEARDLVPKSNPFLRHFFDHIVGPDFDVRLSYIVDELCEAFSVSNVHLLVQKHLRLFEIENEKDPIIHFYEDFLKEYDPAERRKMGAYYTPVPIVQFIVRQVDEILKTDFGLAKGLADTTKIEHTITDGGGKKHTFPTHKVQVLDPAVGTATFLNEIVKFVYKGFEGQEGRWPAYAEEDLLPRLYGFELMMAPYTIAHLKLGMTLQETGVKDFKQRLGVYLTNTLEEGVQRQQDLFTFGLAEAVSHEANEAAKIKHERPIMIVVGNPPYNNSSNNNNPSIRKLIEVYKQNLGERKINLDDDYIKFIRFAEDMIVKNQEGIVAMITNNSFIKGVTHRQMRKHLLSSFDSLYIFDLHGDIRNKEIGPDGRPEENVFDIMQGVSIILGVKTSKSKTPAKVYHKDSFGKRREKFSSLAGTIEWQELNPVEPYYFFTPKNFSSQEDYDKYIKITDLFIKHSAGVKTKVDHIAVAIDKPTLTRRVKSIVDEGLSIKEIRQKYELADNTTWEYKPGSIPQFENSRVANYDYRPFDSRYVYYDTRFVSRSRSGVMDSIFEHDNLALITSRNGDDVFVSDQVSDEHFISGNSFTFPLYLYHDDGEKTANFVPKVLSQFTKNIKGYAPEDIFDYIYAVLWSPDYRDQHNEFLKIDFPRVPVPGNDEQFHKLVKLGKQLRELHLMTSPVLDKPITTFSVPGDHEIEKAKHTDEKVWINDKQYFGGVPETAWNFQIGSYQPAQKWLKDRRGRKLSNEDIEHYQKIIKVLTETDMLIKKADEARTD